jgi:8-oxo-dGTP pyrophosphatase MutT (NUDIX family)
MDGHKPQNTYSTLSAGIIPVLRVPSEGRPGQGENSYRFLLLRAYRHWDFPKGMVEVGEQPWSAARRELGEETGIQQVQFPWGQTFYETEPYSRGKVARYYMGEVFTQQVELLENPVLHKAEHDEFRWVSFEEANELLVPRVQQVLAWAMEKISKSTSGS